MSKEELIKIHLELHKSFDKLLACYISTQKKGLKETNLLEFMEWSYKQTINPSCLQKNK